jgi:hypothetical protein
MTTYAICMQHLGEVALGAILAILLVGLGYLIGRWSRWPF